MAARESRSARNGRFKGRSTRRGEAIVTMVEVPSAGRRICFLRGAAARPVQRSVRCKAYYIEHWSDSPGGPILARHSAVRSPTIANGQAQVGRQEDVRSHKANLATDRNNTLRDQLFLPDGE